MIQIETAKIGENGKAWVGEEPASFLGLEHDPQVCPEGPIQYDLFAEIVGPEILVRGSAETTMKVRCARCAQIFSTTVRVSSFLRAYEWSVHPEVLDVSEDVREDLMLEIPAFVLCREGCKGLCARCGQDLNERPCGCGSSDGFSPFSALDGLSWTSPPENGVRRNPRDRNE